MSVLTDRGKAFRSAIADFIEARREAKLKGKEDDAEMASKYEYSTWLIEAAKRASAIQLTTHPLKATYPDAKIKNTTSPLVHGRQLPRHREIGSHVIDQDILDGTGDAASLGTFKFLVEVCVEGKSLIDWLLADDADLLAALHIDQEKAILLAADFKRILRAEQPPASHFGAKQVYWLVGSEPQHDDQYHLLQPMFSSSLAHAVHADIQDARFGEANKEARQAFRDKAPFTEPYRDYRNLVARKLGGTKPQNVSQLNSERGGVNYLLPSLPPPAWRQRATHLLKRDTALDEFLWFEDVRKRVRALADYLHSVQDQPSTEKIRKERDKQVHEVAEQFALFGATVRSRYPAGWTRDESCRLPGCERLWLDPERAELPHREDPAHPEWRAEDEAFKADYDWGDWPDQVATRFGNWLNARLRERDLPLLAEAEMRHWAGKAILDVAWPIPLQRRAVRGEA